MKGLYEEEKKREAERAAEAKKAMIAQVGASIVGLALETAKKGANSMVSYPYERMSCRHVITIDDMID